MRRFVPLVALALLNLSAIAQMTQPAPSDDLAALVQKLGDPSFAIREKAQKDLTKIPVSQRNALAAVADKTADEEIKARLIEQLGVMDDIIATDMPPISLNLRDATLSQVAHALSQATHTDIDIISPFYPTARFTLSAKDQPFWDVIRQLSAQHPIHLAESTNPATLLLSDHNVFEHITLARGIAVAASGGAAAEPNRIVLRIATVLDPRIPVLNVNSLTIDDARYDSGKTSQAAAVQGKSEPVVASPLAQTRVLAFTAPEKPDSTLTIKGTVRFLAQLDSKTIDIAKATDQLDNPLPLGEGTITFRKIIRSNPEDDHTMAALILQVTPKDAALTPPEIPEIALKNGKVAVSGARAADGTRLAVESEATPGGLFLGNAPQPASAIRVHVTDAKGHPLADYSIAGGAPLTSVHVVGGIFQEPLSFSFTLPTRTREVKIPFELKDIPIEK